MHKFRATTEWFWSNVAQFVGNERTRSQSSQRWIRVLDPKISKQQWLPEEDERLVKLVGQYGEKAWTKVAGGMKNRSDVQCRYRCMHLKKCQEKGRAAEGPAPPSELGLEPMPAEEIDGIGPFAADPKFDDADGLGIPLASADKLNCSNPMFDSTIWLFKFRE
jgi:hypothetical protein